MTKRRILEYCLAVDIQKVCYLPKGTHDVFLLDDMIQQRVQIIEPLRLVRIGTHDVSMVTTNVGYGVRYWFACPGCGCNTKKIFLDEACTRWLCRRCNNLTYLSSNVSKNARRKLKIKIEKQQHELHVSKHNGYTLTASSQFLSPLFKPPNMQQATFDQKRTRLYLMIISLLEMQLNLLKKEFKKHDGDSKKTL